MSAAPAIPKTRQPPVEFLLNLAVTLLTPMFLAATGGDPGLARFAAAQTIESYRAETHSDLITVAKIIAFGLATLGSLSLSLADDLPISKILHLRASATATDRAEHRNRLALTLTRPAQPAAQPHPEPEINESALTAAVAQTQQRTARNLARFQSPAPAATAPAPATQTQTPPVTGREQHYQATWAACTAEVAAETAASLPNLSPEERRSAALWVEALNDAANSFLTDGIPPRPKPGDLAHMIHSG